MSNKFHETYVRIDQEEIDPHRHTDEQQPYQELIQRLGQFAIQNPQIDESQTHFQFMDDGYLVQCSAEYIPGCMGDERTSLEVQSLSGRLPPQLKQILLDLELELEK